MINDQRTAGHTSQNLCVQKEDSKEGMFNSVVSLREWFRIRSLRRILLALTLASVIPK